MARTQNFMFDALDNEQEFLHDMDAAREDHRRELTHALRLADVDDMEDTEEEEDDDLDDDDDEDEDDEDEPDDED